jgi:hypothetical protein
MPEPQSTILTALLEQLITTGPESKVFTALFDLAMRLERERYLGAGRYERSPERRGYANGDSGPSLLPGLRRDPHLPAPDQLHQPEGLTRLPADHPRSARSCAAGPDFCRLIQLLVGVILALSPSAPKADRTMPDVDKQSLSRT